MFIEFPDIFENLVHWTTIVEFLFESDSLSSEFDGDENIEKNTWEMFDQWMIRKNSFGKRTDTKKEDERFTKENFDRTNLFNVRPPL